jgi:uncharacterized membrane protein YkvA (DUF1232 family)
MLNKPSEEYVKDGAQNVTQKDVENVIIKSEEIKSKFNARGPLARFVEDGKLLVAIVKDYWAGAYRQVPYGVIASSVFTLLYVLNPFDLMPDVLPIIGQLDDVAVMGACLTGNWGRIEQKNSEIKVSEFFMGGKIKLATSV